MGQKSTKPSLLNIGSGTGGTIPVLEAFTDVTNVEASDDAIHWSRKNGVNNIVKVEGIKLPFEDSSFDILVAFDVLEHLEDDKAALAEWRRILKPGGLLMVTVPAYQWLWSVHDESLHHYRRYSAAKLHRLLNTQGYRVLKRSYAIAFSFPLIVIFRLFNSVSGIQQKSSHVYLPTPINWAFIQLLRTEAFMQKYINFPFGTSILVVGKK